MQTIPLIGLPAALVAITSLLLLLTRDWRVSISLLAFQYVGAFLLVTAVWPVPLAVTKLVAGWMAGAMLGIAAASVNGNIEIDSEKLSLRMQKQGYKRSSKNHLLSERIFLTLASLVVFLAVIPLQHQVSDRIPVIHEIYTWAGLTLIGMGLLNISFNERVLPNLIGLLTTMSGFEILYANMESSILVAGMLALVNLGLSLAGAFLLIAPQMEGVE
jgi:hypothetical protein